MDAELRTPTSPDRIVFEREVKLQTPTGFTLPDLSGRHPDVVAGPAEVTRLETTYYDSADLALAAAGISLRYRPLAPDAPWILKIPTAGSGGVVPIARRLAFEHTAPSVPPAARDLLHPHLRSRLLLAVASVSSVRTTVRLHSSDGVPLGELVYDDLTAFRTGERIGRFGEVEVRTPRLDRTARALVEAIVEQLVDAGCVGIESTPKLLRAFGVLSPVGVPERRTIPTDRNALGLDDLVSCALADPAAELFARDVGVRSGDEAGDIHQVRVATRRLRSLLKAFRPVLEPMWVDQLRRELGWLGRLAGPVRDADILLARLTDRLARAPQSDAVAGVQLLARLSVERGRRHAELLAGMRSARYDLLLDLVAQAVARPRLGEGAGGDADAAVALLAEVTRRRWHAARKSADAAGAQAGLAELHEIRIQAKRARYTAESAAVVLGKPARRVARAAERVQTALGELQDAVVAAQWLREDGAAAGAAVTVGELVAAEEREIAEQRRAWPATWASIAAAAKKAERGLAAVDRAAERHDGRRR